MFVQSVRGFALAAGAAWMMVSGVARAGEMKDIPHPYILWTKEEAADLRRRIETDETAKKQYEQMAAIQGKGGKGGGGGLALLNLFKYSVFGDKAAGEAEKRALMGFVGALPPGNRSGDPSSGNAAYRDDRTVDALRFDVLYDELSADERTNVLKTFAGYLDFLRTCDGPWRRYAGSTPRTGWLPNMQYPTVASIHVMAAASKDEEFIKEVFGSVGCFKWWMDEYIADGSFYMEEFGKYGSPVWSMLLWCEAMDRLGLSKYGYGYTAPSPGRRGGEGGGSMRSFLGSLMKAAYPRLDRRGAMPDYLCVNMGDAGCQYVVKGKNADGTGGQSWWFGPRMWGNAKMMHPMWWEIGARRFPDDGYDYFLAQMRTPGEEVYLPSLICGLGPIDPKKTRPPAVKSYAAFERGFALLRAEESSAYWDSPKPAVSLQFGMYYVHYVHDCFSILQYVANNRIVYDKMGVVRGGYAGGDPQRDSVRGQASGVTVDSQQIQFVDGGDEGCRNERIRQRFTPAAKYVAVRAGPDLEIRDKDGKVMKSGRALYPGVDFERSLVLTDEYLFDVSWLRGKADHVYDWHVQGGGRIVGADSEPWQDTDDLAGGKFFDPRLGGATNGPLCARKRLTDAGVTETLLAGAVDDATAMGARISVLPEKGTEIFTYAPPGVNPKDAAALMARRRASSTVFVALHEPFTGGIKGGKVARFDRVAQNDQGVAVAVTGKKGSGIDDRLLFRYGDGVDQPLTLEGEGESFTFSDSAYVRITRERVTADGGITAMKIRVTGKPKLVLNGKETPATIEGGMFRQAFLELK